jgi:hypothetical protein
MVQIVGLPGENVISDLRNAVRRIGYRNAARILTRAIVRARTHKKRAALSAPPVAVLLGQHPMRVVLAANKKGRRRWRRPLQGQQE